MLLLSTYVLFANIVEVENEKQLLEKITPNGNPVPAVIKFSTTWCGACKIVKKPFEKITSKPLTFSTRMLRHETTLWRMTAPGRLLPVIEINSTISEGQLLGGSGHSKMV